MTTDFTSLGVRDAADIALQRTNSLVRVPGLGAVSYKAWARGLELPLLIEAALRRKTIFNIAMGDARSEYAELEDCLAEREREREREREK